MAGILTEAVTRLKATVLPTGSGRGPFFWNGGDVFNSWLGLPDERDYANLVGDGSGSSLVGATVGWIARQFPEAPPVITTDGPGGIRQIVPRHPAAELLRRPTWDPKRRRAWYSGGLLRAALVADYWLDGNAYALKVRDPRDLRVVQLWWIPTTMLEPRAREGSPYLDHYDYRPGSQTVELPPSEIFHWRQGLDPRNPLKGRSQLKTALREIYTDEQAARFTAAILRNSGRPGVVIMPRNDSKMPIADNVIQSVKAKFVATFGGDRTGEPMIFGQPTEMKEFGFSPEQLKLGDIRDLPEERITAITGIPAAVIGFGTGLQGVKVGATLREYREQAAENNLIPGWRSFAEEYDGQVLPDFATDRELETLQTGFDLRGVGALQDIELKKAEVASRLLSSGVAHVNEARARAGLQPVIDGDMFRPQPGVAGGMSPASPPEPTAEDSAAA